MTSRVFTKNEPLLLFEAELSTWKMATTDSRTANELEGYDKRGPETEITTAPQTLEHTIRLLTRENKELRIRCHFLANGQQSNKQLALEWQDFGKYTAQVLKSEMETADQKIKFLEEQVERSTKENRELKEMCLYLDQSQGGSDSKLTPPEVTELLIHTRFISKLNARGGAVPRYAGSTKHATLKEKNTKRAYAGNVRDPEVAKALAEMGKRVEILENEKCELIKSLSAAHLLVANTNAPTTSTLHSIRREGASTMVEHPPKLRTLLQREESQGQDETDSSQRQNVSRVVSPEDIENAVTLLDMIRRLDATEANGFTDPVEEAEVATLRILIAIAWQRIQEQTHTNS